MEKKYSERQIVEKSYHDNKAHEGKLRSGDEGTSRAGQYFWSLIGQPNNLTILDFGCGNGWLSVLLGELGNKVYGIDISGEIIKQAKQLAETSGVSSNTTFMEMTAEELDFPDVRFDMIVGNSILHHTELDITLRNIRTILRDDGAAIFMEPLNENIFLKLWRFLTPWRRTKTEKALTTKDIELIQSLFPSTRFTFFCLTSIFTQGLLLFMPKSRIIKFINDRLEDFDEWILKIFPFLGKYSAIVTMEMRK